MRNELNELKNHSEILKYLDYIITFLIVIITILSISQIDIKIIEIKNKEYVILGISIILMILAYIRTIKIRMKHNKIIQSIEDSTNIEYIYNIISQQKNQM